MRCLRCALDFSADERYCDRCGRALSFPLGSKGEGASGQYSTLQDTTFLYSTFSPPGQQADAASAEPVASDGGAQQALPPAAHVAARAALPPSTEGTTARGDEQTGAPAAPRAQPALPRSTTSAAPTSEGNEAAESDAQRFESMEDVLSAFRPRPTSIGASDTAWRNGSPRRGGALARMPRQAVFAGIGVVAVVALALLGLTRHSSYTSDLKAADRLAASGQYAGAIQAYERAIGEWPFNADAQNRQAGVAATATAISAQATAVVLQAQGVATASADRAQMFAAWQSLRQQSGLQNDQSAATATAQAQTTPLAQARATVTAGP